MYYAQPLLTLLINEALTVRILTQGSVLSEQIKVLHCDKNNNPPHSAYILKLGDFEGAELWAYAASSLIKFDNAAPHMTMRLKRGESRALIWLMSKWVFWSFEKLTWNRAGRSYSNSRQA